MKKYVMVHDENLCIGCQGCVVACKNENNVSEGVSRLEVYGVTSGKFPNLKLDLKRQSCVMCEESPCVSVCPTNASFKTADGVVMIDDRECIGCKYCILACPYEARFVDPLTQKIGKCTFCYDNRVAKGENPACVSVCPTDALIFGDANDENSAVAKILAKGVKYPKENLGLKPHLGVVENYKG